MDKETNALEEIRKELEEAKNALTIRTSKLNAVEVTMNEMQLEYENKNNVLEATVVQHQEISMAREKDLRALSLSLESARDELNERFNELQETRTAQDLTATKRLEEVELLKVELLRMHTDRRKALNELTRNQEHVKKHLNKLQEASRAIEKEKEQLVSIQSDAGAAVIHVRIVFISSFLFYCLLLNHSFQTNPNKITNCFKLILFYLQLYKLHLLNAFVYF